MGKEYRREYLTDSSALPGRGGNASVRQLRSNRDAEKGARTSAPCGRGSGSCWFYATPLLSRDRRKRCLRLFQQPAKLDAASDQAAKLRRSTFCMTAAPLSVPGATGSPFNPLAIF